MKIRSNQQPKTTYGYNTSRVDQPTKKAISPKLTPRVQSNKENSVSQNKITNYYKSNNQQNTASTSNTGATPLNEIQRMDMKESPNPTNFSNMKSQNYMQSSFSRRNSFSHVNGQSPQSQGDFENACSSQNTSAVKVQPMIMFSQNITDFKAQIAQSDLSTKLGTIVQVDDDKKGLNIDEVIQIVQEPEMKLKSPQSLPQTQFLNIFKSQSSSDFCNLDSSNGRDSQRSLGKGLTTFDKNAGWTSSTLACTLQINSETRNNRQVPFDITSSNTIMNTQIQSPSSKTAQFHKLENKVLLTQIDDNQGDYEEDPDCSVPNITSTTFRQSLNSTILINNNSHMMDRLSNMGQRLITQHQNKATNGSAQPFQEASPCCCNGSQCQTSFDGSVSCSMCNSNSTRQSRFMINLETVLLQEIKLWTILQQVQMKNTTKQELMILCEEWWEITKDSSALFDIYKIYRDPTTRKAIRKALILETIIIVITAYLLQKNEDLSIIMVKYLHKLYMLAHQNLVHIICMILQRMGLDNCEKNVWAVALKEAVEQKYKESIISISEEERAKLINKGNDTIIKGIQGVHTKDKGEGVVIFNAIQVVANELDKIHINRVKEILTQALGQQASQNGGLNDDNMTLECSEQLQYSSHETYNQHHMATSPEDSLNDDISLPVVIPPFLPPLPLSNYPIFTLVLDLDETLIHYIETVNDSVQTNSVGTFLVRPGAQEFLSEMAKYYEIVIFTAAMQDYADWVLDQLDPQKRIKYRLYRQHAIPTGQHYIKDLSRVGRDISRMIIVDNVAENFQMQPDNGIFIKTWLDDPSDNALEELAPLLREIVVKQVDDVREALRIFRLQMMRQIQMGVSKPKLSLGMDLFQNC